jgi:predicted N-acetyltransferase YhbS
MHTAESHRGRGIGGRMLRHVIAVAEQRGYRELYLETGSMEGFRAARELYRKFGFVPCEPFGNYKADPNSVHMRLTLSDIREAGWIGSAPYAASLLQPQHFSEPERTDESGWGQTC